MVVAIVLQFVEHIRLGSVKCFTSVGCESDDGRIELPWFALYKFVCSLVVVARSLSRHG